VAAGMGRFAMEQNPKSMDAATASAEAATEQGTSAGAAKPAKKRAADRASRTASGGGGKNNSAAAGKASKASKKTNRVREARIEQMMSKAELARRAGLSVLTIDRVEKGLGCRMDTKRKILEALGRSLADRVRVFGEEE
jgi:DNA-binding XRE family transcriptional regulator